MEAVKALERSGTPAENFLRANTNPLHLTEGVHFIRLIREESRLQGMRTIPAKPQSTTSEVTERIITRVALTAPASTISSLPVETATIQATNITFGDLMDEDFSFLDPFLGGDVTTPAPLEQSDPVVEVEDNSRADVSSDKPSTDGTAVIKDQRAPRKDDQEAKRRRRESSSSSSSDSSESSEDGESVQ